MHVPTLEPQVQNSLLQIHLDSEHCYEKKVIQVAADPRDLRRKYCKTHRKPQLETKFNESQPTSVPLKSNQRLLRTNECWLKKSLIWGWFATQVLIDTPHIKPLLKAIIAELQGN